jgi:hypothetical protein
MNIHAGFHDLIPPFFELSRLSPRTSSIKKGIDFELTSIYNKTLSIKKE